MTSLFLNCNIKQMNKKLKKKNDKKKKIKNNIFFEKKILR